MSRTLEECDPEFLLLLDGRRITAVGLRIVYRSSTGARCGSGFGWGTSGVWREVHPTLDDAKQYIEGCRTGGVNWEIIPWPVLKVRVGEATLLLLPRYSGATQDVDSVVWQGLHSKAGLPFWAFRLAALEKGSEIDVYFDDARAGKPGKGAFRSVSVSESVGSQWKLRWTRRANSEATQCARSLIAASVPDKAVERTKKILKWTANRLSRTEYDCTVVDSARGTVLLKPGGRIRAPDVHSMLKYRSRLHAAPDDQGRAMMELLDRYGAFV